MITKNNESRNPNAWCGLNRPDMDPVDADAVVFGIPFDGGASYRAGAAQAPDMLCANRCSPRPARSVWITSIRSMWWMRETFLSR